VAYTQRRWGDRKSQDIRHFANILTPTRERGLVVSMTKVAFASFLLLCGCAASEEQLRTRAAFDLDCAEDKLRIVEIDGETRGVRGCGKHVTYVERCTRQNPGGGPCTWILNSDSNSEQNGK
jgi:hypothetical protein